MDWRNLREVVNNLEDKYSIHILYYKDPDDDILKVFLMPFNSQYIESNNNEISEKKYYITLSTFDMIKLFENIYGY